MAEALAEPREEDGAFLEGPSFSLAMKCLASVVLVSLAYVAWQAVKVGAWTELSDSAKLTTGLLGVLVLSGYWGILTSRTRIDGRCIQQTWLWDKRILLAEITQVKLIYVPALAWLIAPRLVVRSGALGMTTFHAADAKVLAAFRKLAYGE